MKRVIIAMLMLLASAPAQASLFPETDSIDAKYFTDFLTLNDLLRAKGISPIQVNWGAVENLCLSLKTEYDQEDYNRCRYEKITWMRQFASDTADCNTHASAQAAEALAVRTDVFQTANRTSVFSQYTTPFSSDPRVIQRGAFVDCMRSLGWQDADDWSAGKR